MMRSLGIEIKITLSIIFFTLFIVGLERYQLSENIVEQFIESKKSKNKLLIDTISPIVALNISFGLEGANNEYLDLIVKQNLDIKHMEITDEHNITIFRYPKNSAMKQQTSADNMDNCESPIIDSITGDTIGHIYLEFYNDDYEAVLTKNRDTTANIFLITFLLLSIFVYLIKQEFKHLRELTNSVLQYDPKLNNFTLEKSNRYDEVGVIHNAIITMVDKINS